MRDLIKKFFFSKYIFPLFRRIYFLKFKMSGGSGGFRAQAYLNKLKKTEFSSLPELKLLQNHKLQKLIVDAYENVPFYRKVMKERNLTPSDIKSTEDLKLLPILTKMDIKRNLHDLVNKRYNRRNLICLKTSGTTGTPMKFFFSDHDISVRSAHIELWKRIAGVKTI